MMRIRAGFLAYYNGAANKANLKTIREKTYIRYKKVASQMGNSSINDTMKGKREKEMNL